MDTLDALTRVILQYIRTRSGQTILIKNIAEETAISPKTISKKIKFLEENGYIKREGKNFYIVKE